jgi:hypothetical protein
LWSQLQKDPSSSFDTWIRLVDDVQRTDNLEYIRTAHRALLREYPLCYGYWQKCVLFSLEQSRGSAAVGLS